MKYKKENFTVVGWWSPGLKHVTYDVKYGDDLMAAPFPTAESAWVHVDKVLDGLYEEDQ